MNTLASTNDKARMAKGEANPSAFHLYPVIFSPFVIRHLAFS